MPIFVTFIAMNALHAPKPSIDKSNDKAKKIISDHGLRPTQTRLAVLGILGDAQNALTHQELLTKLNDRAALQFDRVTLYRVLDWLLANNIIHKVTGHDRGWRFQLNQADTAHRHAHFQCSHCHTTYCLSDIHLQKPGNLPAHFTVESLELNIKGVCASCEKQVS